ncbi:MAG: hypothetical protein ACRD2D_07970 [Terriglobales bacterium]
MRVPLLLLGLSVGLALVLVIGGAGLRPVTREDTAALAAAAAATPASEADAATGAFVLQHCGGCHGIDTLGHNPQDAAAWSRTVDTMVQMGASVPAENRAAVIAYLAQHFGPR